MPDRAAAIDAALRRLHGTEEAARLSALHEEAAGLMKSDAAARFQLTHAWVFALEAGDGSRVAALEARLRSLGGL